MSTYYDDASLVMIPSGVKDKLYSIKPTDGSGDFTFSRGSDIQATRVNSSGLIEKAKVNLIEYSNDFSNAIWLDTAGSCTRTGGQTGYDGSSDAWLITQDTAGFDSIINNTTAVTGVHTFSVYAKANTGNTKFTIRMGSTGNRVEFDLTGGSVGTIGGAIDATISSVGGSGWYRCSAAFNCSSDQFRIAPQWASATAESVFIQDAALCHGLIAQDYVETTTTAVVEGLTADLPRLDYSGGASCPSLLLEPSRTNLMTQSEYFGAWTGSAVYTANTDISPSGYQDAATLNDNTTGYLDRRLSASITANATHTFTFFVKKTTGSLTHYAGIGILLTGASSVVDYGIINTTTGAINRDGSSNVNSVSYSSESYGDYWRVIITFTDNQSNTLCRGIIYPAISTNGTSISPSAQGSNVFWGAQLEAGSYPTSYIPTYGTAANRGADSASKTSATALIGQTEGTLYLEAQGLASGVNGNVSLSDGANNNKAQLRIDIAANSVAADIKASGVNEFSPVASISDVTATFKIAIAYSSGDSAFYVNGSLDESDTTALTFATMDKISFDRSDGNQPFIGRVKQLAVFKTRLTNAELAALTTI